MIIQEKSTLLMLWWHSIILKQVTLQHHIEKQRPTTTSSYADFRPSVIIPLKVKQILLKHYVNKHLT